MSSHTSVKTRLCLLLLACALLLCAAIIMRGSQSPYDRLKKQYSGEKIISPSECLYQEVLEKGVSVVFYINQRGKYACAVMKDTVFGWKALGYSGSLTMNQAGTYLYGSFVHGSQKYSICWGLLADDKITEVFLDNEPCAIVDTAYDGFRIFWSMGTWESLPLLTTDS